jgi:DNA invertase Pin-like site-specific DNA recombinase
VDDEGRDLPPRQHAGSGTQKSAPGAAPVRRSAGWAAVEYVDRGVSGAKDRRPALDRLLTEARRRRFDVLVCWRLDRLGRNLRHLITLLDELQALGVAFISLAEGIDATTPAGRLQMQILGAIAGFERGRIVERVRAGLARARAQGQRLGRPRRQIDPEALARVAGLPDREAARRLGVPRSTYNGGGPKNLPNQPADFLNKPGRSDGQSGWPGIRCFLATTVSRGEAREILPPSHDPGF